MLEHTFFTNDVLPMRRGEMRTVLTPFSKFSLILSVSCVLSVKFSPSTDTPKMNVLSIPCVFCRKSSKKTLGSQTCGPQTCEPETLAQIPALHDVTLLCCLKICSRGGWFCPASNVAKHFCKSEILPKMHFCKSVCCLKFCNWHYVHPITVFLNCALIVISYNNKIITL